jgi:hypothetical protein
VATRYIGGPWTDGLIFFGSSAVALGLGAVMVRWPRTIVSLWLLWLWLVDGPHLLATFARTYLDREMWQQQRQLLLGSLLWLLPGPLVWAAVQWLHVPSLFPLFLAFAALWAYHHAIRQHYGFVAIYHQLGRPAGQPADARFRRRLAVDRWFLYLWLWGSFGVYLLAQPYNRLLLGLGTSPSVGQRTLMAGGAGLLALLLAAYLLWLMLVAYRRQPLRPGLLTLSIVATMAVTMFVVGMREPLVASGQSTEQLFMASSVMGGTLHGLPYIGVVLLSNRRRFTDGSRTWLARWSQRPLRLYASFVVAALLYMLLNSARGVLPDGSLWTDSSRPGQLFLALYWCLFFHHYYLDSKIWRVSRDRQLRKELGAS